MGDGNPACRGILVVARGHCAICNWRPAGMTEPCLDALVAIALDPAQPAAARVAACREVLDRGHGRPQQAVELTGAEAGPVQIEDVRAENFAIVAAIANRMAGAAAAGGEAGSHRQLTNGTGAVCRPARGHPS
jgi:hypothetical protein